MNKHTSKRSFLEVYSSEEEEITDVNRLQEEFEDESILSDSLNAESTNSIGSNDDVTLRLEIGRFSCLSCL